VIEPIPLRKQFYKEVLNDPTKEYTDEDVVLEPTPDKPANIVSSELSGLWEGWHAPALDIDIPCEFIPSSTEGHGHLYFPQTRLTWEQYEKLLDVLDECGIIEPGFCAASKERKATYLRLPGVVKRGVNNTSDSQ
jgi:hypothetical protein